MCIYITSKSGKLCRHNYLLTSFGGLCRYIFVPKAALEHEQQDKINVTSAEITRLKETREKLEASVKAAETEFRELVQQSPALLQSLIR